MVGSASHVIEGMRRRAAGRSAPLVLELDLTADLVEGVPADPVTAVLSRRRPSLRTVVDGLRRAGEDPKARVLLARIASCGMPIARAQELRDAVGAFRAAGGYALAFAETFGEFGGGTVPYYLATAFDEVWLAPPGDLGLTGVALETPFVRDTLDRLGVQMDVGARYEYKNAMNTFVERDFTPPHLEATRRIVESCSDMIVAGVASGRSLSETRVRELIDAGPLPADEALSSGLVDRLGYRDEVYEAAKALALAGPGGAGRPVAPVGPGLDAVTGAGGSAGAGAGADVADADADAGDSTDAESDGVGEAKLIYLDVYRRSAARSAALPAVLPSKIGGSKPQSVVAVIHGTGPVVHGRGPGGVGVQGPVMSSEAVSAAFRAAAKDDSVIAAVFRVDSPGGSYVASDVIRREVERFRASGRPVVVSMGAVAGSGGYFVALAADTIVAQPGTLTGSIGVLGGKQVLSGLLDKAGVRFGAVAEGENALMMSPRRPFTASERDKLETFLDRVYEDFVGKVAEARGMTRDAVHAVARGRVWTGLDAYERGLVDVLGGFERALEVAWERTGQPVDGRPPARLVPRSSVLERTRQPKSSEDRAAAAYAAAPNLATGAASSLAHATLGRFAAWGSLAGIAAYLGLPAAGPLVMPAVGQPG